MTPEEAYEALLRNGGRRVDDEGYTGHPYHWYFHPLTGVLCIACQCGFKSDFPQFVRPAPDEPDHDLAYDLPERDLVGNDPPEPDVAGGDLLENYHDL